MSLSNIQNQGAPIGNLNQPKKQKTTKRVADIILNKNHAAYTGPDSIGIIFFTDEKTKEEWGHDFPFDRTESRFGNKKKE